MASKKSGPTRSSKKKPTKRKSRMPLLFDAFRVNKNLLLGIIVLTTTFGAYFAYNAYAATTGSSIVAKAASQLGVREVPMGSNRGPVVSQYTQGRTEGWCTDFVSWVYWQSGHRLSSGRSGWNYSWDVDLKNAWHLYGTYWGRSASAPTPAPGDVVWQSGHTAIVDHVSGTTVYTINGNWGDKVARGTITNYRSNTDLKGWGRLKAGAVAAAPKPAAAAPKPVAAAPKPAAAAPKPAAVAPKPVAAAPKPAAVAPKPVTVASLCPVHATIKSGSTGNCVKYAQQLLNRDIAAGLVLDGQFGPATLAATKRYQTLRKLAVDGIIGPLTWAALIKG